MSVFFFFHSLIHDVDNFFKINQAFMCIAAYIYTEIQYPYIKFYLLANSLSVIIMADLLTFFLMCTVNLA